VLAEGDKSPAVCPEQLAKRIRELADRGPVLIFVPRIVMVETWVRTLRSAFTDWPVEGSHSRDAQRPGKIADLKAGVYRIFVSTLILERGITIDGVQVIILAADHAVFETRALVQMAGRAGRTAEHPEGSVYYLSRRKNRDMQRAIQQIQDQNALACARNLLDAGGIQGV
jgi:competence protein ComFA